MSRPKIPMLVACVFASRVASAQPGAEPGPLPELPSPPIEEPVPPPPIEAPPPVAVAPVHHAPAAPVPMAVPAADRPTDFSIGIGVGYQFPTSLQTPNIVSVRLRLAGGLTFEPTVVLATAKQSFDNGMATTGSATEAGAGVVARIPLVRRRRTDLELLASVVLDHLRQDPDDSIPDDQTSTTTFTIGYGLAVGTWITPHFQVSLAATNGLVVVTKNREELGQGSVIVNTTTGFGATFDPTVTLMLHLYN